MEEVIYLDSSPESDDFLTLGLVFTQLTGGSKMEEVIYLDSSTWLSLYNGSGNVQDHSLKRRSCITQYCHS